MNAEGLTLFMRTNFQGVTYQGSLVVAFVGFLLIFVRSQTKEKPRFRSLPTLPITSWEFLSTLIRGEIGTALLGWYREHQDDLGDVFQINSPTSIFRKEVFVAVANPRIARKMLNDPKAIKPEEIYGRFKLLHDKNLTNMFVANGHRWAHARKSLNVAFSSSHVKRMRDVTVNKVEDFMRKLDKLERSGKSFDVGKELVGLTLKVICDAAFQYEMDDDEVEQFTTNLYLTMKEQEKSSIPLRRKLGRFIPTVRRAIAASRTLDGMAEKMLEHYRNMENPIPNTVIDCIAKNPSYENDNERKCDMILLLTAGHDTTAYSIAFTLIELAKHPEEQTKLRNDLLSYSSGEGPSSLEGRYQSEMLARVIKEGMRLNPIAPMSGMRKSSEDFVDEETNIMIPKGIWMSFTNILILRDPRLFPNPDSFQPSRWEGISKEAAGAFFPFSLGKRNCVGQSLANAEMKTVLSMLCAHYEITMEEEGSTTHFATYKPVGYLLKARKISQ